MKLYLQTEVLESTAAGSELREIVNLPDYVSHNEWLASHCLAFFDHINLLYGTISEFCTTTTCADMNGPNNRLYLWIDEKGKRLKLPAPQYIDYVMTYTQRTVNDKSIFPTKFDKEFPISFQTIIKKILMLLFHVLAHIYHSHFKEMEYLNLHSQMNCVFSHFMLFNEQFQLVDSKETEILQDLANALKLFPQKNDTDQLYNDNDQPPRSNLSPNCNVGSANMNINENDCVIMDDVKVDVDMHNVITTQCRSISPFIDGNLFSNEEAKPMEICLTPQNSPSPIALRLMYETKNESILDDRIDKINESRQVPLDSLNIGCNYYEEKKCDANDESMDTAASKFDAETQSRRCSSASAILQEPILINNEPPTDNLNNSRRSNSSGYAMEQDLPFVESKI